MTSAYHLHLFALGLLGRGEYPFSEAIKSLIEHFVEKFSDKDEKRKKRKSLYALFKQIFPWILYGFFVWSIASFLISPNMTNALILLIYAVVQMPKLIGKTKDVSRF